MANLISLRAYARHRGVTLGAVQKAIKSGRITLINKKIDSEVADIQWAKNTDVSQAAKSGTVIAPPDQLSSQANVERNEAPSKVGHGDDFYASRAKRERYEADKAELAFLEQVGKLVSADQVKLAQFKLARTVRDAMLNLPDRLSAVLAAETSPAEIHRVLTRELNQALHELTEQLSDSESATGVAERVGAVR